MMELKNALNKIIDPSLKKSLGETNGIKHFAYDDKNGILTLIVAMGKKTTNDERELRLNITKLVKQEFKINGLKLEIEENRVIKSITNSKCVFIGVASGKGGVGKSTVVANIAYRLMKKGHKVGIIDADIYGSSIPFLLEIPHTNPTLNNDKKILPLRKDKIETISTEFFTNPSEPVIWRGGMLHSMLENFFYEVDWDKNLEYMLIDLPPGTGDIMLDLKTFVPQAKMLLVTTPHLSASHVAVKAGYAAQKLGHEILGIIENMSYYINPVNKEKELIFGEGGGIEVAKLLGTELIAQIPINHPLHNIALYEIDEEIGKIYDDIADFIIYKTSE